MAQVANHVVFADPKNKAARELNAGALSYSADRYATDADAKITIQRSVPNAIVMGQTRLADQVKAGKVTIEGKKESPAEFVALLDKFDFWFNIVES